MRSKLCACDRDHIPLHNDVLVLWLKDLRRCDGRFVIVCFIVVYQSLHIC